MKRRPNPSCDAQLKTGAVDHHIKRVAAPLAYLPLDRRHGLVLTPPGVTAPMNPLHCHLEPIDMAPEVVMSVKDFGPGRLGRSPGWINCSRVQPPAYRAGGCSRGHGVCVPRPALLSATWSASSSEHSAPFRRG